MNKVAWFCILFLQFSIGQPFSLFVQENFEESSTKTFYLSNGKELTIKLSKTKTILGEGENTVITAELSQKLRFRMKQTFWSRKFSGFHLLEDNGSPFNLFIYLSQNYDEKTESYNFATTMFNFRAKGLVLKCKLEAYIVESQSWEKIGTLRLKGDRSSDQFQIKAVVARIRLSNFQLKKM